jgi:hypothetical protein
MPHGGGIIADSVAQPRIPPGGPVSQSGLEAAASAAPERAGGPSEGIQVHGHWTIEVRNPDGTLAGRTEFENALSPAGEGTLMQAMSRNATPGLYLVELSGSPQPCGAVPCASVEAAYSGVLPASWFKTLTVSCCTAVGYKLSGTATASQNGTITLVSTFLTTCDSAIPPGALTAACTGKAFI